MSKAKNTNPSKVTFSSAAKNKGKTGIMRKEKHLSAQNKRNQTSKDARGTGKKR